MVLLVLLTITALTLVRGQSFDPNKAGPQSWDPASVGTNTTTNTTYNNPIFTANVGDPYMTRYSVNGDEWYLFTYSTNDNITLRRSRALTDNWDHQETRVVFNPDSRGQDAGQPWSTDIWAPEIHNISGKWYIIFTATPDFDNPPPLQDAACPINCTPFYCLGLLELVGNDPMQYQSWRKYRDGCVFHQNSKEKVFATGHASFTTSPDGSENYIVYHAMTTAEPPADIYRTVRAQKFTWNDDGTPNFPLAENGPFPVPSGQKRQVAANERSLTGRFDEHWQGLT
ncbi:hypothetical protein N8I77_009886 [Diaporthe amygdali]|uniref:Glycoside hydrolase family 43 protein n=1 Tax=Phomopsis amygdali TaxID=1214568 RepID=A0AAD9S7B2_PHOAM|nr:hypothetical protein N8I77_009886 [Diaporthe amygdali]